PLPDVSLPPTGRRGGALPARDRAGRRPGDPDGRRTPRLGGCPPLAVHPLPSRRPPPRSPGDRPDRGPALPRQRLLPARPPAAGPPGPPGIVIGAPRTGRGRPGRT